MFELTAQNQYKFVHTAVRELLLFGDTTIKSADLRGYISRMARVDKKKKKSGFEDLFEVYTHNVCIFISCNVHVLSSTTGSWWCRS